jgi:malate dehydrogenase
MVDSILNDRKRVLPCAVLLRGEYKIDGLVMGVPIILGASGVERIIEVSLTDSELSALRASAGAVQSLIDTLEATKA